jgi:hypothetical protein
MRRLIEHGWKVLAAALVVTAIAAPVWADDYGKVGHWSVDTEPNDKACAVSTGYMTEGGQIVQLRIAKLVNSQNAIGVGSPDWVNLFTEGNTYTIGVEINGDTLILTGRVLGPGNGSLYFFNITDDMIERLAKGGQTSFTYQGYRLAALSLPGLDTAIAKRAECLSQYSKTE